MPFTDPELDRFLDDALPPEQMAAIEAALRDDESLKARLASFVGRRDAGVHSLGAVWRRHRLSCPTREQLGSYLLGVLDPAVEDYVRFHLETTACRCCQASVEDLREQTAAADKKAVEVRRTKYFQSSAGYLSGD
jgi:anti-sigma factor RsiW